MGKTMRIRRDDDVIVIGGKDRGKRGRVILHPRAAAQISDYDYCGSHWLCTCCLP